MIYHVFFNCFAMTSSIFKYALVCTLLANSTTNIFASQPVIPPLETNQNRNPEILNKIDKIITQLDKDSLFDTSKIYGYNTLIKNGNDEFSKESDFYVIRDHLKNTFKELNEIFKSNEEYPINLDKNELINNVYNLLNTQDQPLTPANFFKFYSQSILLQSYIFYKKASNSPFWNTIAKENVNNYIADFKFLVESLCKSDNPIVDLAALERIFYKLQKKPDEEISVLDNIKIFTRLTPEIRKNVTKLFLNTQYLLKQSIDELDAPTIIQNIRDRIRCIYPDHPAKIFYNLMSLSFELYNLPQEKSAYSGELTQKIKEWYLKYLRDFEDIEDNINIIGQESFKFNDLKYEFEPEELKNKGLNILNELENWIKTCHQDPQVIKEQIKQLLEEINKNATLNVDTELLYDAVVAQYLKQFNSLIKNKISNEKSLDNLKIILEKLLEIEYGGEWRVNCKKKIQQQFLIYLAQNEPTASTDNIQQPQNALSANDIQQLLYNYFIPELGKDCAKLVSTHFSR